MGDGVLPRRISPFGHRRIIASVQLPDAFRRLRVLHRQLVPRHSSRTLKSFSRFAKLKSLECSMHTLIVERKRYATVKELKRWPPQDLAIQAAAKGNDTSAPKEKQAPGTRFSKNFAPDRRRRPSVELGCAILAISRAHRWLKGLRAGAIRGGFRHENHSSILP